MNNHQGPILQAVHDIQEEFEFDDVNGLLALEAENKKATEYITCMLPRLVTILRAQNVTEQVDRIRKGLQIICPGSSEETIYSALEILAEEYK